MLLNAAAAIIAGGLAKDFTEGLKIAAQSIDTGNARNALRKLTEISWQSPEETMANKVITRILVHMKRDNL